MNNLSNAVDITSKRRRPSDLVLSVLIYAAGIFTALMLLGIVIYVVYKGAGKITLQFLTTVPSSARGTYGILGNLINTLYITVITLLISTPIGIGAAIYLNEYAKNKKLVRIIEFTTEILSGIPSIIYGLFGMVFFGIYLKFNFSIICGALTLSIMVLPIIIRTTQEALRTVPQSYRSGSMALGATKWHVIRTILLPCSMPGIITCIILAVGRIVGESAALLFTAGSGYLLPKASAAGILGHAMKSGGTLTIGLYLSMAEGKNDEAFATALILLVFVILINCLTKLVTKKYVKRGKPNE